MNHEYYDEEMMLKEAITSQKTDQEIGMPDIEDELRRVKQLAVSSEQLRVNNGAVRIVMWRRVAAIALIAITISGLSWAFVYYQNNKVESASTVQQPIEVKKPAVAEKVEPKDTVKVSTSEHLTLSYEKASLEQIILDLSAYYHLDKPVFADQMAARKYMMHITFNQLGSIHDAIDLLNNFGSVQINLGDNKLTVNN